MKRKLNFVLTLSVLLGFSYGLSNFNEVKAEERIIIANPSYGLGYSINLAKDECIDIDRLNNSVLSIGSLNITNTTLNTTSSTIKHSNDFNDLLIPICSITSSDSRIPAVSIRFNVKP